MIVLKIVFCVYSIKFINKLQPRILKKGEVKPPDNAEFVQCYSCGNVFPVYEAHYESEIKDSLETVNNPFEESAAVLLLVGKRKKRDRLSKYQDEDPDIQAEIDKGNVVNILYDTSR